MSYLPAIEEVVYFTSKDTLAFPDLPDFVVTTTTPLAALDP